MWRSAVQLCLGLPRRTSTGGLAQLARAPALQAGGRRFESVILHSVITEPCILHEPQGTWQIANGGIVNDIRSLTYWDNEKLELANQEKTISQARSLRYINGVPPCRCIVLREDAGDSWRCEQRKVGKGEWRMPRLLQAMKDVISCDKPR